MVTSGDASRLSQAFLRRSAASTITSTCYSDFGPLICLADVLREIKKVTSRWVHEELTIPDFEWQEGYGAFTVSASNVKAVRKYISTQAEHHHHRSFEDEYRELLEKHEIEFDERFLW